MPQPYPVRKYSAGVLDKSHRASLNVKSEVHKSLLKVHIVSLFWPNTIPKPILIVVAIQGSAKTTLFGMIRDLVDPNVAKTVSIPKELHNMVRTFRIN